MVYENPIQSQKTAILSATKCRSKLLKQFGTKEFRNLVLEILDTIIAYGCDYKQIVGHGAVVCRLGQNKSQMLMDCRYGYVYRSFHENEAYLYRDMCFS